MVRAYGLGMMPRKDDMPEGCTPPDAAHKKRSAPKAKRECILCGKEMFFAKEMQVHVCLNKVHGVLAYYSLDDCYFTSREDVAVRFAKEGRKFHIIEAKVLQMIGVES